MLGDRAPLDELLLRHWQTAAFLAGRVLGSPDLGCDAAQEAAVAAMTNLDRLRTPASFGAWFCGIALNVAMDLAPFQRINPCGYKGMAMTQVSALGGPADVERVGRDLEPRLIERLSL